MNKPLNTTNGPFEPKIYLFLKIQCFYTQPSSRSVVFSKAKLHFWTETGFIDELWMKKLWEKYG